MNATDERRTHAVVEEENTLLRAALRDAAVQIQVAQQQRDLALTTAGAETARRQNLESVLRFVARNADVTAAARFVKLLDFAQPLINGEVA